MNDNENYIMIGGKKIPLTEEQIHLIQADEPKKSPFDRADLNDKFYFVESDFNCLRTIENNSELDNYLFECGNYCTDESIMKQHALHVQLNNLLWRYSMTHGGDTMTFDPYTSPNYYICYNVLRKDFFVHWGSEAKDVGTIYFKSYDTATNAIDEIIKPFVAEHPDFDVAKM